MKVAQVDWFGGRRNDGKVNDFGFVFIDPDEKNYYMHQSSFSPILKQHPPREHQYIFVEVDEEKRKVISAKSFSELPIQNVEDIINSPLGKTMLEKDLEHYWPQLSEEMQFELFDRFKHESLSNFMVPYLLDKQPDDLALKTILASKIKSFKQPIELSYDHFNYDETLINYAIIENNSLNQCLDDKRFTAKAIEQICIKIDNGDMLVRNNLLHSKQQTYENISLDHWFTMEPLHKRLQHHALYAKLVAIYANQQQQITDSLLQFIKRNAANLLHICLSTLDHSLLKEETILPAVPADLRFNLYNTEDSFSIEAMTDIFAELKEEEKGKYVKKLLPSYQQHPLFITFLPAPIQAIRYCKQIGTPQFIESFRAAPLLVKNYIIYKLASTHLEEIDTHLITQLGQEEENRFIKALLYLLFGAISKTNNTNVCNQATNLIEEEMEYQTIRPEEPDMLAILPKCPRCVVSFCEGKTIEMVKNGFYCPRTRRSCQAAPSYGGNIEASFENWSIEEMYALNQHFPYKNLLVKEKEISYFSNKIAGWANRIQESRERLKCSNPSCQKAFQVNYELSKKFTAAYMTTVFSCDEADGSNDHDHNVYLNHCRCCGLLIDSRESKYQVNEGKGYYICIHCGAAEENVTYYPPMRSPKQYEAGDICPKCNYRHMPMQEMYDTPSKWKECSKCHHSIKVSK